MGGISWEIMGGLLRHSRRQDLDENPFCKVKTQKSSVKVNEFVPREVVDKLMKKANPVCQLILGLSRYPVFLHHSTTAPQNTPNTRK